MTQYYMYVSSVGMKFAGSFSVNPIVGDEVCREFFGEPNSGPHELNRR